MNSHTLDLCIIGNFETKCCIVIRAGVLNLVMMYKDLFFVTRVLIIIILLLSPCRVLTLRHSNDRLHGA